MEVLTLLTDKLQHQTLNDVKGFDNDMLQNVVIYMIFYIYSALF